MPVAQRVYGEGSYLRPNFVQPYRSKNILIAGVTIINAPMWEVNPVLCTNVTVRGVKVNSHGPNNDGYAPEACTDVLIEDCIFDTGDDCIAIKSGRDNDGRRVGVASENIIVRNSEAILTVDFQYEGGANGPHKPVVRNVTMENVRGASSPRVMWIAGFAGATIDNIRFVNCAFGGIEAAEVVEHAGAISFA